MAEDITTQQRLAIEQKYRALEIALGAIDSLDGKLTVLLQGGGLVTALIGLLLGLRGDGVHIEGPLAWALAFALSAYFMMVLIVIVAWRPGDLLVPGSIDWDRTFDRIIYETVDNAYNEVLDSVRKSLIRAKTITEQKGRAATLAATMLLIQIRSWESHSCCAVFNTAGRA